MGIKTCINGHKFDESLPECPFCPKHAKQMKTEAFDKQSDRTLPDSAGTRRAAGQFASDSQTKKTLVEKPQGASLSRKTVVMSADQSGVPEQKAGVGKPQGKLVGWLASFSWNKHGQDYRLNEGRTRIGTDRQSDVRIDDALMSGIHAQMVFRSGVLEIQDSFSTNGTVVNGVDIRGERTELKDGDILKLGNTVLKLRLIGEFPNE